MLIETGPVYKFNMRSCVIAMVTNLILHRAFIKCSIKLDMLLLETAGYKQGGQLAQKYFVETITINVKMPPYS